MNGRGLALGAALALATGSHAATVEVDQALLRAMHEELAALRARVAVLERQIADTVARPEPAVLAPPPVRDLEVDPEVPAVPTGQGREASTPVVSFGGRIKVDAVANTASAGAGENVDVALFPGAVPLDRAGESGQIAGSARGSRLWFKVLDTIGADLAAAYVELDFYGAPGGNERVTNALSPRLRHAYATFAGLTVGQTWSTFMNPSAYPEINDDGIPAGGILARQPLVRYDQDVGPGTFSVALEAPETTLATSDGARIAPDDDRLPDLVARYIWRGGFGNVALASMLRELRHDGSAVAGTADARVGYALGLSGRLGFGDDELRFMLTGGNAVARYMSFNAFEDARIDDAGAIHAVTSVGGYLAWQHWWSPRWRSNLVAGGAWQDADTAAPAEDETLASLHANLLFSPLPSTTAGLEVIYARRARFDGRVGHLGRLQLTAVRKF